MDRNGFTPLVGDGNEQVVCTSSRSSPTRGSDQMRVRTLALLATGVATAVVVPLLVNTSAGAVPATAPSAAADANATAARAKLMMRYATVGTCTVHPNYPKEGVVGNESRTWTVAPGRSVIWRYNVNETWAMISDPSRAKKTFPWWGFTRRDCLGLSVEQKDYPAGVPVPSRILEGRSQRASGWRPVDFSVAPAPVVRRHRLDSTATLRDPANFAIGNVFPGWTVQVTSRTRNRGHWVEVYVPNAKRWGYVEAVNLR